LVGILTPLFGILSYMGQVGPKQAVANYAEWYAEYIAKPPAWINSGAFDFWVSLITGCLAAVCLFWLIRPWIKGITESKDMTIHEWLTYLRKTKAAWQRRDTDVYILKTGTRPFFEDAAASGKLKVRGRLMPSNDVKEIDRDFWITHELAVTVDLHDIAPDKVRTRSKEHSVTDDSQYDHLRISRSEVEALWPIATLPFKIQSDLGSLLKRIRAHYHN